MVNNNADPHSVLSSVKEQLNEEVVTTFVFSGQLCNESRPAIREMLMKKLHVNNDFFSIVCGDTLENGSSNSCKSVDSVMGCLMKLCRKAGLVHPRATLLTVKEQQQALLLCLARRNKEIHGEFCATASDLMDAWNALGERTVTEYSTNNSEDKKAVSPSIDPVERDMDELVSSYSSFIKTSNNIDQFALYISLYKALKQKNAALLQIIKSKVFVCECHVTKWEWQLLSLLLGCNTRVYTLALERVHPSKHTMDLDISGIGEDLHGNSVFDVSVQSSSSDVLCNSEADSASLFLDIGDKPVQVFFSPFEDNLPITQSIIESKCTDLNNKHLGVDPNILDKSSMKTPLTRLLSGNCFPNKTNRSPATPKTNKKFNYDLPKSNDANPAESDVRTPTNPKSPSNVIRMSPQTLKKLRGKACFEYVQQVMVSQVRLLLNTRDELALAINCSLPGTELSQAAFTDIKEEAHKMHMPMFQTIVSVILKLQLGGRGYQPAASSPILSHVKPLTQFVDHINKLTDIVEDSLGASSATIKILNRIKKYLIQQCSGINSSDCPLKVSTIESVHTSLLDTLAVCRSTYDSEIPAKRSSGIKLPAALEVLQRLCDIVAASCGASGESGVALVDDGSTPRGGVGIALSQGAGTPLTPMRVPSVLTLFRTPPPSLLDCGDEDLNKSLLVRVMKGKKQGGTGNTPRRFQSCMSWAPENVSPLQCASPSVLEPVLGPTLVSAAPGNRRSADHWQEVLASLPADPQHAVNSDDTAQCKNAAGTKTTSSGDGKNIPTTSMGKKRSSKRSLLTDISHLASNKQSPVESTGNKKQKTAPTVASKTKGKKSFNTKINVQPTNQKSIMSYFKTS